jgi:hypothetical protein
MSLSRLVTSLLEDSKSFLLLARNEERAGNDRMKLTYSRAVFLTAFSALEGWVNYISVSFAYLNNLQISEFERAFLQEKRIEIDDAGDVKITNQDNFQKTSKKMVFILKKFGNYDILKEKQKLWSDFKELERIRNALVHPKKREEEVIVSLRDAERCFEVIDNLVNTLKDKIYH